MKLYKKFHFRSSFTLIELLVVIAILAVLSTAVVLVLNPAELVKASRDATRLADLNNINKALVLLEGDITNPFLGTSSIIYVSIPDTSQTCANLGLPTLPTGWTYHCASTSTLTKTDGTGWIPVNFTAFSGGSILSRLPIDPTNTTSTGQYYTYTPGGSWHLTTMFEASRNKMGGANDKTSTDKGKFPELYETGTNLTLLPVSRDTNLVGWWTFDEGSGTTAYDYSGNGNNGTWYGSGTRYIAGKVGNYSAVFNDATDDYIDAGNSSIIDINTGDYSLSFWFNELSRVSYVHFLSKGGWYSQNGGFFIREYGTTQGAYELYIPKGDGLNYWIGTGIYNVTSTQWHHFVLSIQRTGRQIVYIDNQIKLSFSTINTNNLFSSQPLRMGNGNFTGYLDDIRIYNRALSANEVKVLYDLGN